MSVEFIRNLYREFRTNLRYKKTLADMISHEFNAKELLNVRFIFWGSPEYNNLGDHAIAYAIVNFLRTHFEEIPIIEIPEEIILNSYEKAIVNVGTNDVIILTGGGNLGNQYMDQRLIRNVAIKTFHNNPIIVFPQTAFYTPDFQGKCAMRGDKKVFSSHKKLHIFLREEVSYQFMCKYFKECNLYCVPDIVLSLDERCPKDRKGILLCLRDDVESILSTEEKNSIAEKYPHAKLINTCLDQDISIKERENTLKKLWCQITEAELVITDRLHGVIFCAITGTRCIAISNYNHKVIGTLKWLRESKNIVYCESVSSINLISPKEEEILDLDCQFERLVQVLNEQIRNRRCNL